MLRELKSGILTFDKNDNLASIRDSLERISKSFALILPDGFETIPSFLCMGLENMQAIAIPSSVSTIDRNAFEECVSLEKVYIKDLAAWCNIDLSNYSANPLYCAHHLYKERQKIEDLMIPRGVTEIKYDAFYNCTGLTSVTIPDSVTSIGNSAFENCTSLESVTIGNNVMSIKDGAFESCTDLESITIPESVTYIGAAAFCFCTKLKSVAIGGGAMRIEGRAFAGCGNLKEVIFENPNGWSFDVSDPKQAAVKLRTRRSDLVRY